MNKIDKDELFQHVSGFFKNRGIELKTGPYTAGIQKGCELLADTVNLSQEAWDRARIEMERNLDHMRQVIHERTAPKSASQPQPEGQAAKGSGKKSAKARRPRSKRSSRG
jgi:hypothetical protein